MREEVLALLKPAPGEIALDCTLGFAGHARAIMERVAPTGRLIGLEWDGDQLERARALVEGTGLPFALHHANFAGAARILAQENVEAVDLLVADLGMSSMQVDDPERGFSYVRDGPLDMRMDRTRGKTATAVLATISQDDLAAALEHLGDEPQANDIARAIVEARKVRPILRTTELAAIIAGAAGQPASRESGWRLHPTKKNWQSHPAARTFQALRILVNRELANLQELLRTLPQLMKPGGRVAIISFHSGEDRMVKNALRQQKEAGWWTEVAAEPVRPSEQEKLTNPRSRSAKLRWSVRSQT
jgi:16S rRNA (cytosine1402-N4)-methyltransferase